MKTLIARPGNDGYGHCFGGDGWTIRAPAGAHPKPALVLTLDASDPRLSLPTELRSVPLCSRLDSGVSGRQTYVFDPKTNRVVFEGDPWNVADDPRDEMPQPLPY